MKLNVQVRSKDQSTPPKLSPTHFIIYLIGLLCQYNMFIMWKHTNGSDYVIDHRSLFGILPLRQINYCSSRFNTTNLDHPHLGASDKSGRLGCVVNLEFIRERLKELPLIDRTNTTICTRNDTFGVEGEGGNLVLKRVRKALDRSRQEKQALSSADKATISLSGNSKNKTAPRILCMVYTVYTDSDPHASLGAIARTWASGCDGFFAASNFTDPAVGAIDLPHFGEESYQNMWQKVRTMWSYAYEHYLDDYDYFYICGDDTYVVTENLRAFLQRPEIELLEDGYLDLVSSRPIYRQRALHTSSMRPRPLIWGDPMIHKNFPVIAGGGGYILNRAALDFFGTKGMDTYYNQSIDSREDIFMSSFFWDNGVGLSETVDVMGGHRFTESAEFVYNFDGINGPTAPKYMEIFLDMVYNKGMDYGSETHISFHLKVDKPRLEENNHTLADLIHRYHAIMHHICD